MKKLFLIPLMTLMTCVMAFADNVARIGETEYATVAAAIADAESGATITLLANTGGDVTLSKNITLNGDKKFTGNITLGASEVTLTLAGVTIDVTGNDAIVHLGKTLNIVVADGTTNAIYAKSSGCDCFYGISNGHLNISGNGTLAVYGNEAIHVSYMNLSAPNATYGASGTLMYTPHIVSATISAGTFDAVFPDSYVSAPLFIEKVSSSYQVSNIGANKAVYNYTAYATLQAAVDAAPAGATIVMYADDNSAVTIDKPLTIEKKGHSINTSAGAGIALKSETSSSISYMYLAQKNFVDFLTDAGTASMSLTEDIDISTLGQIEVNGTKTLTINNGVKVLYKRQSAGANILVPVGAKLTVLGSGTFQPVNGTDLETNSNASAQVGNRAIDVNGELVVGAIDDDDNCPHFITTSIARGSAITTNNGGITTINNANVQAANYAIWNEGTMYINGGIYTSTATSNNGVNGYWYGYCIRNQAKMVLKNATVVGNHGAVSCEGGDGTLEIHGCNLQARNLSGLGGVHYALYVCTKSVVSAYDTKFYSEHGSNTIVIGDNDSQNSFGLIYLYGGCKSDRKLYVQKKRGQDDDILFPVLVSEQSEWYKRALIGGQDTEGKLLPANTVYSAIEEQVYDINGNPIEGKKYLFGVESTAEATQEADDDPTATIPWQQSSTWDANKESTSTEDVPTATTVVTIPEGKAVVISADENENNGVTEAKAEQIFLADGASLTVETGTKLTVGEGGVNIANGGQLVVEPGAIVTVGSAGLVTTEDEALVIEATEEDQGVFLLKPEVTENTQPKATVKLVTKCKQVGANEFIWERFAIPTLDGSATTYSNEGLDTVHYYGGATTLQEGLYEWDGSNWAGVSSWKNLQPFKGYQLTNNSMYGNVVYTFEGNLVGNSNMDYHFTESGFGFFGNSYTGDIDIMKFFESFGEDMQKTIWIYDYYTDQFKAITETSYGTVYYGKRNDRHGLIQDIRSMQAFLMNTFATGASAQNVDYSAAIWGNPKYGLVLNPNPAPAHSHVGPNVDMFTVYVVGEKQDDEVRFIRGNEYSAAFDNGADASKWMNNGMNLYVTTEIGDMSAVASDEIVNMTITFQSGNETEYTLGFDNISGEQYELRDVLTGATIQMTESTTYTFSQEANTTIPARFQVVAARKVPTGIEDVNAPVMQKVMKDGNLYILRDNQWYNAQGQILK